MNQSVRVEASIRARLNTPQATDNLRRITLTRLGDPKNSLAQHSPVAQALAQAVRAEMASRPHHAR